MIIFASIKETLSILQNTYPACLYPKLALNARKEYHGARDKPKFFFQDTVWNSNWRRRSLP